MSRLRLQASLACLSLSISSIALVQASTAVAQEAAGGRRRGEGRLRRSRRHLARGRGGRPVLGQEPRPVNLVTGGDVDPHQHSVAQKDSYGVQSRLSYRAIVDRGRRGRPGRVREVGQLPGSGLPRHGAWARSSHAEGSGVSYDEICCMASHNHSSPYYMTPSWGVWVFQDAFDMRAFEYHARPMAAAILEAEDEPGSRSHGCDDTSSTRIFKGMIQRAGLADDGTPRGYPDDFGDFGLVVIRFDDISRTRTNPTPLATLDQLGPAPRGSRRPRPHHRRLRRLARTLRRAGDGRAARVRPRRRRKRGGRARTPGPGSEGHPR